MYLIKLLLLNGVLKGISSFSSVALAKWLGCQTKELLKFSLWYILFTSLLFKFLPYLSFSTDTQIILLRLISGILGVLCLALMAAFWKHWKTVCFYGQVYIKSKAMMKPFHNKGFILLMCNILLFHKPISNEVNF